jgi:hypothetical protein
VNEARITELKVIVAKPRKTLLTTKKMMRAMEKLPLKLLKLQIRKRNKR